MDEIVRLIQTAEKKTPVKVYVRANRPLHFENCHVFTPCLISASCSEVM